MGVGFITGDRPVFPRTDLQIRKIRRNMCGQVARPGGGGREGGGQVAGPGGGGRVKWPGRGGVKWPSKT
jgi:hypothetical protein